MCGRGRDRGRCGRGCRRGFDGRGRRRLSVALVGVGRAVRLRRVRGRRRGCRAGVRVFGAHGVPTTHWIRPPRVRRQVDRVSGNEQRGVAARGGAAGIDAAVTVDVEAGQPGERDRRRCLRPRPRTGADRVDSRRDLVAAHDGSGERGDALQTLADVRYVHAAVPGKHLVPARTCRCLRLIGGRP